MTSTDSIRANTGLDPYVEKGVEAGFDWPVIAAIAADSKLATAPVVLDVGELISVTDHFVITNGANPRQIKAIAQEIELQLKLAQGPSPVRVEGKDSQDWVLLDYGFFIVHIFSEEARGFYQLERLWKDCEVVDWRTKLESLQEQTTD